MFGPRGSKVGLQHENKGKVTSGVFSNIGGATEKRQEVYRNYFSWSAGFVSEDPVANVRIANIDISDLKANNMTSPKIIDYMIQALGRVKNLNKKYRWYINRTVKIWFDIQKIDRAVGLEYKDVDGKNPTDFRMIPVGIEDQILNNEARVV